MTRLFTGIWQMLITLSLCGQFQIAHYNGNTTSHPRIKPLILNDGNIVTYHWDDFHILRRYAENGELIWSKSFDGTLQTNFFLDPVVALSRDGSSGFVLARYVGTTQVTVDTLFTTMIQCDMTFMISRWNSAGDPTETFTINKQFLEQPSADIGIQNVQVQVSPDGGIVMLIHTSSAKLEVVKLNGSGQLEWSRSVGQQVSPVGEHAPAQAFDNEPRPQLAIGQDGSIYYIEGGQYFASHLRLTKLNADGELVWMNRYIYNNNVTVATFHGLAIDQSGTLHTSGYLVTTVGRFHILYKISSDGVMLQADIYRTPYFLSPWEFGLDAQGNRYDLVRTQVNVSSPVFLSEGLLVADQDGSNGYFIRRISQVVPPNNVFLPLRYMDVFGDRITLSGHLHHEDINLAYTTRYESLMTFDSQNITSCFLNDTTLQNTSVPASLITTENITNAVSLDVLSYYTAMSFQLVPESLNAELTTDLCVLGSDLLGLGTGVDNSVITSPTLLDRTMYRPGEEIKFNITVPATIEVWNSAGQLISRKSYHQHSAVLSTSGWKSGIYLIRGKDLQGGSLGAIRVIIE